MCIWKAILYTHQPILTLPSLLHTLPIIIELHLNCQPILLTYTYLIKYQDWKPTFPNKLLFLFFAFLSSPSSHCTTYDSWSRKEKAKSRRRTGVTTRMRANNAPLRKVRRGQSRRRGKARSNYGCGWVSVCYKFYIRKTYYGRKNWPHFWHRSSFFSDRCKSSFKNMFYKISYHLKYIL